jgi:protein-S-isoprenylcysteine O-methyltransferase Ste14
MTRLLRYFLPFYLVAYFLAAFLWRFMVVRKKTGINPVVLKGANDAHGLISQVLKAVAVLIALVIGVFAASPRLYRHTCPFELFELSWLKIVGMILLLVALVWTVVAQAQMGESWRVGIDQQHRTELVWRGVFRASRNPIFLGMISALLGMFLTIPNAISFLILVLAIVTIQIQVRLEEDFLLQRHGERYEEYRRQVRRWL